VAIPQFLDDAYNEPGDFTESITDVATILTTVEDKLVTNGNWTKPSAGLFKSVVDAAGDFLDVLLTRIDADTLEWRVRDRNGNTIVTRRIAINAAGTTINYYWGNYYLVICSRQATAEVAQAFLVDPTAVGDLVTAVGNRTIGGAYRSTGDVADAHSITAGNYFAWDNGASAQFYRMEHRGNDGSSATSSAATNRSLLSGTGRALNVPANIFVNQAGVRRITGALPSCLVVDSSLAFDAVRNGPLDGSTVRKFIVLPLTTYGDQRLAIRKPSSDV
jgi:hypothetical protein